MCCDCSLVHNEQFKIVDGQIYAKLMRNERATAAARRKKKKAG